MKVSFIRLLGLLFTLNKNIKSKNIKQHQHFLFAPNPNQGSHCLFLARLVLGVCELNASCHLNLLWATYYRLLLLSSLVSLSHPSLVLFSAAPSLWFSFSMMRQRARRLPFSCLSIIPLSVSPSGLIGVWETLASSQRAQPEQWRPI